ncbi:MAG: TIGR04283 family arsenosugar biosynthesis glycosyltransferase [Gammaproteobacteria bacterium]|nr:TIGR04283 family arsenosugar biosynthesis glycosyltransferase [Gammaproteobacteria bacterium]
MNSAAPRISIVVPMLNEAPELPATLAALRVGLDAGCELILVDGGSSDGSVAIARAEGFSPITGPRGRARQMNAGAAGSRAEVLLFLHADTRLPDDAVALIEHALASGRHRWGRFDVRIAGRPRMLRVIARLMNLRSRLTGIATGDQAIFVTRAAFAAVGGFPDQPLMEDIELSRRLLELSRPACLRTPVVTSGRRWEQRGLWRTMLLMWRLRWAYWRGVSAAELATYYR